MGPRSERGNQNEEAGEPDFELAPALTENLATSPDEAVRTEVHREAGGEEVPEPQRLEG